MNRKPKIIEEPICSAESLLVFEGWEIRRIDISEQKTAILLQNPNDGTKKKLCFKPSVFDGKNVYIVGRKCN